VQPGSACCRKSPLGEGPGPSRRQSQRSRRPRMKRVRAAWHAWLSALANRTPKPPSPQRSPTKPSTKPAERSGSTPSTRTAPLLSVPKVAVYAPLLSVETEPVRRARIERPSAIGGVIPARPAGRALRGIASNGDRIVAVGATPLLICACPRVPHPARGRLVWARRDPIIHDRDALRTRSELEESCSSRLR